jgi:hypothetical protein
VIPELERRAVETSVTVAKPERRDPEALDAVKGTID